MHESRTMRILIPESISCRVLKFIHMGHWGVSRCKQMAQNFVYWPRNNREIEELVSKCQPCQENQALPKAKYLPWQPAGGPLERIHVDFSGPYKVRYWLVIVDAFSRFPYVYPMRSISVQNTIDRLSSASALEGLPLKLVTDIGTQFTSGEFKHFCTINSIEHLRSAPFHRASNGEAERFVRIFKNGVEKALADGEVTNLAVRRLLMSYRTTPSGSIGKTHAELLHGRRPMILLSLRQPPTREKGGSASTRRYTPKFRIGQHVYVRMFSRHKKWIPGQIIKTCGSTM